MVIRSLVSELESLSEEQRLPAKVRTEGGDKRRARNSVSGCPSASTRGEVLLLSPLLNLAASGGRQAGCTPAGSLGKLSLGAAKAAAEMHTRTCT